MTITAAMVKELRDSTGAGMMDCKKALGESDGNMEAAVELLRKKGAASAEKKAGRIAAEGVIVFAFENDQKGALVEINCETDFVAKDSSFVSFAKTVADCVVASSPSNPEALASIELETGKTVEQTRQALITTIGENISIRRFEVFTASEGEVINGYLHGNRIGVIVKLGGGQADLVKDIAMHIAATNPMCISDADMPADTLAKEREIYAAIAKDEGKPDNIIEKIVEGKINRYLKDHTLLGQPFVKDPDQTVAKLLQANDADVRQILRYEVGDGIEKRSDDFVAEVMAQAKGGEKKTPMAGATN